LLPTGLPFACPPWSYSTIDIPVVKGGELDGSIYWLNADGVEQVAPHVA